MKITGTTKLYGLFGTPVEHSMSRLCIITVLKNGILTADIWHLMCQGREQRMQ